MNKTNTDLKRNLKGSIWHRWEPHIHTPETILNNQFNGVDVWNDFFEKIENSVPIIRAIGITDYYSIDNYEKVVNAKQAGRLKDVGLIFPNIELRFNTGTASGSAINGHILVSPEDANHISETKRFLNNLTFFVGTETFRCTKDDLIKLGRHHDKLITSDNKALEVGTNQFKVDPMQLIKAINESEWAKRNILIAVAVNSNDGTSGLSKDSSFSALRKTIEGCADLIMTGHDKQRNFWLGKGVLSKEEIRTEYKNLKPCIHGSDAHSIEKAGNPDLNRFTWIKGDLTFESLKQICIEPEERVFIGDVPINNKIASNIIDSVSIANASWLNPAEIDLNSGLIAIIGARGSGKTALADLISVGGLAITSQINKTSFIRRAQDFLSDVDVSLAWLAGGNSNNKVCHIDLEDIFDSPRVQYLSQQFVDTLCSSEGMTDELMKEIERVIFSAHPAHARLGVSSFQELLRLKSAIARTQRSDEEQLVSEISKEINIERNKKSNLPNLKKKEEEKTKIIAIDKTSRQSLLTKGLDDKISSLTVVSSALDQVGIKLERLQRRKEALFNLDQAIKSAINTSFPNYWNKLKDTHLIAGLSDPDWNKFKIGFTGNVEGVIKQEIINIEIEIAKVKGIPSSIINHEISYLPKDTPYDELSYELLLQETERLKKAIGIDNEKGKQYARLTEKILKDEAELEQIKRDIADANNADEKITGLMARRKSAYKNVFSAIIQEEEILGELYQPLKETLKDYQGSLSKLMFKVQRHVDTETWAARGEALLDLRKAGGFKGKGVLLETVNTSLKKIWEKGNANDISEAIANFRNTNEQNILSHAPCERNNTIEFNRWANQVAEWLNATDHIKLTYSVLYDGVEIQQLSPGTRGIVLLLLYLAIDKEDNRPLIIDQPEENLDPKSIFDELVPLFRSVKSRRQIIIVTHNANLVVNTDADQVIVAECGSHRPGQLPIITYKSGGLENPDIRQQVCKILEGGEAAFKERAKRLRVNF